MNSLTDPFSLINLIVWFKCLYYEALIVYWVSAHLHSHWFFRVSAQALFAQAFMELLQCPPPQPAPLASFSSETGFLNKAYHQALCFGKQVSLITQSIIVYLTKILIISKSYVLWVLQIWMQSPFSHLSLYELKNSL